MVNRIYHPAPPDRVFPAGVWRDRIGAALYAEIAGQTVRLGTLAAVNIMPDGTGAVLDYDESDGDVAP